MTDAVINVQPEEIVNDVYEFTIKESKDIINDLNVNFEESLIYKSIINSLEKNAAECIKNNLIVRLPHIGCIRKNPIQQSVTKNYKNFKDARASMTKSEYKEYFKGWVKLEKERDAYNQHIKKMIITLKRNNRKLYNKYAKNIGPAYANMWITSLLLMNYIPYDQKVQDAHDKLKNKK